MWLIDQLYIKLGVMWLIKRYEEGQNFVIRSYDGMPQLTTHNSWSHCIVWFSVWNSDSEFWSEYQNTLLSTNFKRVYIRWFRIFQTSRYQGIVKAAASGVFEDLKFKISEGSDQNLRSSSTPETAAFTIPWYLEV